MNTALPSEIDAKIAFLRDALKVLKPAQHRLLSIVLGLARPYGYCWAEQRTLADRVGSAKSTVASDLQTFYALGLVRILKPDVARAYKTYEKATGRSNVIVPTFGLDQAMADLRAAEEGRTRAARAKTPRMGRPRVVRKKPSRGSARCAGVFGGDATAHHRSRVASKNEPTTSVSTDQNVDFRPKAPTGPITPSRTQSVPISKSQALAALPENDAQRKDAEDLIREGLDRKAAIQLAKLFAGRPGLIARNIALGEHRTKANPPGWLTTAIREDYASARISPHSEAAAVRRAERPVKPAQRPVTTAESAPRTLPPKPMSPPPEKPQTPIPTAPELSPEDQARLTARAWEDVRKTHAFLGTFSPTHPVIRGAISRAIRQLYEREKTGELLAFGGRSSGDDRPPKAPVHRTEPVGSMLSGPYGA